MHMVVLVVLPTYSFVLSIGRFLEGKFRGLCFRISNIGSCVRDHLRCNYYGRPHVCHVWESFPEGPHKRVG
jgi:hypothetical protein